MNYQYGDPFVADITLEDPETSYSLGHINVEVNVIKAPVDDESAVYRTARVAFSYAIPSASVLSIKKISTSPLTFEATVDVATPSRYGLQSVLFRKNNKDAPIPLESSQSALWLEPGHQIIQFSFDNSYNLAEDQLALGYFHLTDYGQLKMVYQHDKPVEIGQLMD